MEVGIRNAKWKCEGNSNQKWKWEMRWAVKEIHVSCGEKLKL
jgi:hypothetical protein